MPQPIIDPAAIQTLRELCPGDNDAFLREIVGMFQQDTPLRITELEDSLGAGDAVTFKRAAHSIKGSSANMGANALKDVAGSLESASDTTPIASLAPSIDGIRAEFERAKAELERVLAAGPQS